MTFERNPGLPPEAGPTPVLGTATPGTAPTPVQVRLQILSTEHWSLLASRSLAWNESFTRAGMYLSTLSGAMVALGLIAGIDHAGDIFFAFAYVILPVELFIGLGTVARMSAANYHDAMTIYGMNRIRGAYLEIAPDLAPYFVMGVHDDAEGIGITMAVPPGTPMIIHLIAATPFTINVLNSVVAGTIAAVVLVRIPSLGLLPIVLSAIVVALLVFAAQGMVARNAIRSGRGLVRPIFPTPAGGDRPKA
jgi:hypothetical protein